MARKEAGFEEDLETVLQMPRTRPPDFANFAMEFMTGEKRAIAPVRR